MLHPNPLPLTSSQTLIVKRDVNPAGKRIIKRLDSVGSQEQNPTVILERPQENRDQSVPP
jgi:hypothetical protein